MKLGIIGAIALGLGVWALVSWWWFVVEIILGLAALILVISGALALAVSVRKIYRAKQAVE